MLRVAFRDKGPWPPWSLVTAHDLSAGGVKFTCEQPFQKGERLVLSVQFMEHEIECEGTVTRAAIRRGTKMVDLAVRFEGLSETDKEYITRYSGKL